MRGEVKVCVYNTYFTIIVNGCNAVNSTLHNYLNERLTSYKIIYDKRIRRTRKLPDRKYFHYDKRIGVYFLPISIIVQVLSVLKGTPAEVKKENIVFDRDVDFDKIDIGLNPNYTPRDYQDLYIDSIVNEKSPLFNLVDLKPGSGKTFISINAMSKLGMKTGIVVLPKYIEKWTSDIAEYTTIPEDRVRVIRGSESLIDVIKESDDDNYDIVIFSLRTLYLFIKEYEEGESKTIPPYKLFSKLKLGILLSDETHQELGALFKVIMYSNVKKVIGLSATFIPNNDEEDKIQNIVFPQGTRISNLVKFDRYIDIYAVGYQIEKGIRIKDRSSQGYNHIEFEKSIMHVPTLCRNYLKMVNHYVNEGYIKRRKEGEKCLVFFASIDMCTLATNFFKTKYPDLIINRYIGEDDYSNLMSGDIIVSTVLSSGTAVDIPKLITVVQTISIGSAKSNVQATGRLRKIEGRETRYYYLYCKNNPNQYKLHRVRENAIKHMAKIYYKIDHMRHLTKL